MLRDLDIKCSEVCFSLHEDESRLVNRPKMVAMSQLIQNPPQDAHIAACGLLCTNCGKFKKGRCKGCQIESGFSNCSVRLCCIEKEITTCAECDEFVSPRDYRECRKLNNFIARIFALIYGSNRPAALAMLRDQGEEAFLSAKRETMKM